MSPKIQKLFKEAENNYLTAVSYTDRQDKLKILYLLGYTPEECEKLDYEYQFKNPPPENNPYASDHNERPISEH